MALSSSPAYSVVALLACWHVAGSARAQATAAAASNTETSERVTCGIAAAIKYAVPANLVLAVADVEGGKPGQWVANTNGSFDVGPMQINTSYLRALERYGITADDVAAAGCYAYELATWRLARHLARDHGDLWQRAANYHSRTPAFNAAYRAKLMVRAAHWARWLKARYSTREFEAPASTEQTPPARSAGERNRSEAIAAASSAAHWRAAKTRAHGSIPGPRKVPSTLRAGWVQTADVHLTPDELRALLAGP